MNDNPLVSVLMTAYNREEFIAEAIESVLASTYGNFELIIVDDCSKDNTVIIANKFAAKDKRIRLYVNDKNLEQFPNRNKAASYAKGFIIMCVDSDDTIKSDGIGYVVEQFSIFPEANFAIIYPQNDIDRPTLLSPEICLRKHFYKSNHLLVGPGGTAIKNKYFQDIGGFPTNYGPAGDCYYNIKAASNSIIILLPYVFFNYRIHGAQEFFRRDSYLYNGYRYFEDVMRLPELPLSKKEIKGLLKKNKQKFFFYTLVYFMKTWKLKETLHAYKKADVGIKEIWEAIF